MLGFEEGYKAFCRNTDSYIAARLGEDYVKNVADRIFDLESNINSFTGYNTATDKLKGDIAEFWHSGTFNIDAAVKGKMNFTQKELGTNTIADKSLLGLDKHLAINGTDAESIVDRSHDFASADITSNYGIKYGLKYYADGQKSADAHSMSFFQRYSQYKSQSGRADLSFLDYMKEKGIDEESVMYDPIYSGQVRIIPADQLKDAVEYLKWKIAKETLTRPEQAARYQDTLNNLATKLESPDGVGSIELTEQEAKEIATLAKEGRFKACNYGLTTEELINFQYIIKEGLRAGYTAAMITFVLKTAPEVYKCIDKLVKQGEIAEDDLKKVGFAALSGTASGFLRGFVTASLTTACKSGALGAAMKSVDPSGIAGLTVVFMETLTDSYKVVIGDMPANQMADNLIRNIIVTASGVGLGIVFKTYLAFIPGSYLLGNFVGTAIGSFVYQATDDAIMSYCINNGCTFFGLVKQDYKLPDEVMLHLGFKLGELEKGELKKGELKKGGLKKGELRKGKLQTVYILKRGVIGFHRIGYI